MVNVERGKNKLEERNIRGSAKITEADQHITGNVRSVMHPLFNKIFYEGTSLFRCVKCKTRKPIEGRKAYKRIGEGSDGRSVYNYMCKECYEGMTK